MSQARYFITFINECTRMTWVSLLHKKSDVITAFREFYSMVKNQFQKQIKVWQSDNAMEFLEKSLGDYLRQNNIRHHTSCTYTRQQNGLAERKNRQIMEVVRASLFGMHVPRFYWEEAVKSVVYIINRVPFRVINFQTPHQKLQSFFDTH
jgi:transposase InsO family protein